VPDLDDFYDPPFVVHRVDDPIGSLADAVALCVPGELVAPVRAWGLSEALDSRNDSRPGGPRLHRLELFGGGRLD
jgi:hypothetical protein